MADGKVTISTALDNSELKKGIGKVSGSLGGLKSVAGKLGKSVGEAFSARKMDRYSAKIEDARKKIADLENQQKELTGKEIQTEEFSSLAAEVEKTHKSLDRLTEKEDKLRSLGVSEESKQWQSLQYDLEATARKFAELETQRDKMLADGTATVSGTETEEYKKLSDALEEARNKLAELQRQQKEHTGESAWAEKYRKATDGIAKSTARFGTRLREIVRGALIFNFISAGLRSVTTRFSDALKSNDEYADALARLKGAFYTAFQPLYEAVLPALITFIRLLTVAVQAVGRFFSAITGKDYAQMEKNAEALYNQKDAIDGVAASAKDAQKDLAGFDEINRLSSSQDSGGSAGGGGEEAPPIFSGAVEDAEKLLDIVLDIGAAILGWKVSQAFSNVLTALTGTTLTAPEGFLLTLAGVTIALAIKDIVVHWEDIKEQWSHTKGAVLALINGDSGGFWTEASNLMASWMGTDMLTQKLMQPVVDMIYGEGTWASVLQYLQNGGSLKDAFSQYFALLWENVQVTWGNVSTWFDEHVIQPVSQFFTDLWEDIKQLPSDAWDKIKEVWGNVSTWFDEHVIQPVSEFFGDTWGDIGGKAQEAWAGIKEVFSEAGGWFKKTFENAWNKVKEVFSPMGDIFVDIKDGVVSTFKKVVNGLITGINKVIAVPFKGINWALTKIKDIEILGFTPFKNIGTISIPEIPQLAKGAVIPPNAPFAAILGDQRRGTNIEAPLDTIKQAVAEVLRGSAGGNPSVHVTIVLDSVDGKKLFDAVVRQNNAVVRATGASPLRV